jgi:hypothetical protein
VRRCRAWRVDLGMCRVDLGEALSVLFFLLCFSYYLFGIIYIMSIKGLLALQL